MLRYALQQYCLAGTDVEDVSAALVCQAVVKVGARQVLTCRAYVKVS